MPSETRPFPDFRDPPVTEVALSIQFEPIDLAPVHVGMFGLRMRELGYGRIEQHQALSPVLETFGGPYGPRRIALNIGAPAVRHWFVAEDDSRLVQLQADRLIHNWRKAKSGDHYPRYDEIKSTFLDRFADFSKFISAENIGEVLPNQVEVTYVNHIRRDEGSVGPSDLADVVGIAGRSYTDQFLPGPEDTRTTARYVIESEDTPVGRLHVSAHTAVDLRTEQPIIVVNLTARGAPLSPDMAGVIQFMDLGREWIVRGFADITTPRMHEIWGRIR